MKWQGIKMSSASNMGLLNDSVTEETRTFMYYINNENFLVPSLPLLLHDHCH